MLPTGVIYVSDLPFNEAKFVHLRFWSKATDNPTYVQKPDIIAHFVFREIPILKIQYAVTT